LSFGERFTRTRRAPSLGAALLSLVALLALAPRPGSAAPAKALDEYFRGAVVGLDGTTVTLRYDFQDAEQVKDWVDRIPYRIKQREGQGIRWFDDRLEVVGNAGARHKAEWMGDILVTATFVPDMEKDFGGYLSPVTETEDFATFTFVETWFHAFDNSAGGTNSIIKFGAQWREGNASEDYIGFRYVSRKPPKEKPAPGKPIRASFGLQKKKLVFVLPEYELKGADKGERLTRFFLGFYAIKGRLLIDNVEIQGQLATDWLRREEVELRTTKPIGAAPSDEIDEPTRALLKEHAEGSGKATRSLLGIATDETRSEAVREAVVAALCSGPKKAVRHVLDLLYSPQEPVREVGIRIVKALLGEDFGYKAKGSEKSRDAALKKLTEELRKDPDLLKD
jgi:hypothetical protein